MAEQLALWTEVAQHPKALCPCADCGIDTMPTCRCHDAEYYMVHDQVWEAAGLGRGHLCIGCLEARLGRRLTPDDFTQARVNTRSGAHKAREFRTGRMRDRLGLAGGDRRG